jgi:hypothetical protein
VYVTGKRNAKGSASIISYRVSAVDEPSVHALVYEIFATKLDGLSPTFYFSMLVGRDDSW